MLIDSSSSNNNDNSEADGFSFDVSRYDDDTDEVIGQDSHVKFVNEYQTLQYTNTEVQFLICSKWMNKFKSYLEDPCSSKKPNMVNNSPLISKDFDMSMSDVADMIQDKKGKELVQVMTKVLVGQVLREGLLEHNDYVFVDSRQWELLKGYFCADFEIPRVFFKLNGSPDRIEVYPIEVQCEIRTKIANEHKRVRGSKFVTLKSFLGDLAMESSKVFRIDHDSLPLFSDSDVELRMEDTIFDILTHGEKIVVVSCTNSETEGESSSIIAMEGDNSSQQDDNMSVDDLMMDIKSLEGGSDNLDARTASSIVPYIGDKPPPRTEDTLGNSQKPYYSSLSSVTASIHSDPKPRGLTNLGNTCFMNATLQCFASLEILVAYYMKGGYRRDMNVSNVLGTGGKLARAFSSVIKEMMEDYDAPMSSWGCAVAPRQFKHVLGQFASQFMGYDQHDCHELATYLLDAIHEDCNLIAKKPYVEKPEKKVGESDEVAAQTAWAAHTQREDSYIVNNFHWLMKSHVECPICDKDSITFDPMAYLSVPIPVSNDIKISFTYAPLQGSTRVLKVKINKNANMEDLFREVVSIVQVSIEDLCIADIYHNEVYSYYALDEAVDKISPSDTPFVFELASLKPQSKTMPNLNIYTWLESSDLYSFTSDTIQSIMNGFDYESPSGCTRESIVNDLYSYHPRSYAEKMSTRSRFDRTLKYLTKVQQKLIHSNHHLDCRNKRIIFAALFLHKEVLSEQNLISVVIQTIGSRNVLSNSRNYVSSYRHSPSHNLTVRVFRISSSTTVFEFRELMSKFYGKAWSLNEFRDSYKESLLRIMNEESKFDAVSKATITNSDTFEEDDDAETSDDTSDEVKGSSSYAAAVSGEKSRTRKIPRPLEDELPLEIFHRLPLLQPKYSDFNEIGSLDSEKASGIKEGNVARLPVAKAQDEQMRMMDVLEDKDAKVVIRIPPVLQPFLDEKKLNPKHEHTFDDEDEVQPTISLYDCINAFTHREQLDKSESYYCSHCKDHVQAHKECGIYFASNILIIHLKRFYFSSSSHRRDKIEAFVEYPIKGLDLTQIVSKPDTSLTSSKSQRFPPIYDLYAVSNHYGGLGGGHYTAYAQRGGKWYNFDDSRVTLVDNLDDIVSRAGYVLYYVRRGISVPDNAVAKLISDLVVDFPKRDRRLSSDTTGSDSRIMPINSKDDDDTGEEMDGVMAAPPVDTSSLISSEDISTTFRSPNSALNFAEM